MDHVTALTPSAPPNLGWTQRCAAGARQGLPWWGAVLLALSAATVGAILDRQVTYHLGTLFDGAYLLGCVAAVRWVRPRSLVTAMMQPPLILAPVAALGTSGPSGGGVSAQVLAAGSSVASHFAVEAVATAVTLLCGGLRLVLHHRLRTRTPHHSVTGPSTSG